MTAPNVVPDPLNSHEPDELDMDALDKVSGGMETSKQPAPVFRKGGGTGPATGGTIGETRGGDKTSPPKPLL